MVLQHFWHPPDRDRLTLEIAYELHLTPDNKALIPEVSKVAGELHRRYISGKDTQTWCQKCAFMWDVLNKKLCPVCRVNYCDFNYEECFECHRKPTDQGDLFSK
jgi:hypothetical protein